MIEGSSDSKISHENLFQIRNLIENLAPAEPKNFIKREKSSRKFYRKLKFLPEYSQRNIKDLVLYSSISKGTKFSAISHLSGLESWLIISLYICQLYHFLAMHPPTQPAVIYSSVLTHCPCHARSSQLSANSTISTKYHSHPRQLANDVVSP